jgi:hypothetical protein
MSRRSEGAPDVLNGMSGSPAGAATKLIAAPAAPGLLLTTICQPVFSITLF